MSSILSSSFFAGLLSIGYVVSTDGLARVGVAAKNITPNQKTDKNTSFMLWIFNGATILILLLKNVFITTNETQEMNYLLAFKYIILLLALLLRLWSMKTLSVFFTRTLTIVNEHKVIRDGPYRWFRHPGYLANCLFYSTCYWIGFNSIVITFIYIIIWNVFYKLRMDAEEEMLIKHFGKDYEQYKKETCRLIPFIY